MMRSMHLQAYLSTLYAITIEISVNNDTLSLTMIKYFGEKNAIFYSPILTSPKYYNMFRPKIGFCSRATSTTQSRCSCATLY